MRPLVAVGFALLALTSSAAAAPLAPGTSERSLRWEGRARRYLLHVPPGLAADRSAPLLVVLHGGGGDVDRARRFGYEPLAAREGFVLAYPEALEGHWNDGRDVDGILSHDADVDDVGFIAAVIERLAALPAVDADRVYLTGCSNGGMMTYRFAIERPDLLAACAAVIANLPENLGTARPRGPLPLAILNGTDDPLVPYDGGEVRVFRKVHGRVLSTAETVDFWVAANGAAARPVEAWLPDRDPDDGTRIRVARHESLCAQPVVLYTVEGGGHTLPGGRRMGPLLRRFVGPTSRDASGVELVWRFVSRFRR